MTQAVAAASTAMLNICGCVVFFGSLGVVLGEIAGGATIIRGIFEFSSGVIAAKQVAEPAQNFSLLRIHEFRRIFRSCAGIDDDQKVTPSAVISSFSSFCKAQWHFLPLLFG